MVESDDVYVGRRAEAYLDVIGHYGDPLRMIVANMLIARALNYFGGEGGRERIAKPHTLILDSIAALSVDTNKQIEAQVQELIAAHTDTRSLADKFPSLNGTSLLDLGSGNGYLGGWLSTLGVRYTGVEPSAELHQAAQHDWRLAGSDASLLQATIRHFCENNSYPHVEAPTLISIIGVIDHLVDPEGNMRALFDFLARRKWMNVPVLVATFDPDFFLPGLPIRDFVQSSAQYRETDPLSIRDPAVWEKLFASCGFHLLEQRPVHISGLPPSLSKYLHALHEKLFSSNASASDGGKTVSERTARARVPPRQGPFYFWLLCPRNATIEPLGGAREGPLGRKLDHVESFNEDERLSVIGNLGSRVYRIIKGRAFFDSPETGRMEFGENTLFGQYEMAGNYVSSRIFGTLAACADSRIEMSDSRQILSHLVGSDRFTDELFLSLLNHLSSVIFAPFTSPKRIDDRSSQVLTGTSYTPRFVSNIAACLLQASANELATALPGGYQSRILVVLGTDQITQFVYGPHAKREAHKLMEILPELVQGNVIDSFSAHSLGDSGTHEKIEDLEGASENTLNPLHIGWQAARFILHSFELCEAEEGGGDVGILALSISAFLGFSEDRKAFQTYWRALNSAERRSHKQAGKIGRPATRSMPRTEMERCDHALGLVKCSEDERKRLRAFLSMLHTKFDFNTRSDFARKHAVSEFIVVRDIWALLACLLDEGNMWNTAKRKIIKPGTYIKQETERPRIIAYIQECIAYAGRQSGLDNCPW